MSQYDKDKLEAVELEIKTVKARKLELLKKEKRAEGLTTDEQVELEQFDWKETLQKLEKKEKDWIEIIKLGTKEEVMEEKRTFRDADSEWISSVTSINTAYREWTSYNLDDSIFPSEQFYSRLTQSVCLVHLKYEAGRRFVLNEFLLDVSVSS